ncbi:MAG: FAD-binding oxidoreductase, partial [Chitinophagaceae bacterium]|nr:FAD-binding oxidoreductase [Chitinophagaceae bacterium]
MKKTSIWRDKAETTNFDCLRGNVTADAAIIGGGITGITSAYLLGKAGLNTVVLESLRVGGGTTGFSTGNLYCTVDEYLHSIKSKYGKDKLKTLVQSRVGAVDLIRNIVQEFNIDCELTDAPFYFFAESEEGIKKVDKEAEAAQDAGLNVSFEKEIGLPFNVSKAMKLPSQAQFNPMKYVKQLSTSIHGNLCTIYEGTKVKEYKEENDLYTITTKEGTVTARHILLATHTPKG